MGNNILDRVARYSSNVFVPPSFTFLTFLYLAIFVSNSSGSAIYISLQGLILGLLLPIIFFFFIKNKGMVSDIDATIKEERLFPYLFGLTISTIGIVLNWFLGYDTLAVIWVIYFATMLLLLVINKFWKISAHALGVSIPFGVLIFYEGLSSIYYIPMILLICWSRIHLKKHSVMQVVFGAVLGLFFSYTIIKLL